MSTEALTKDDIEGDAAAPLYPRMVENPELRWSFIRKVYSILLVQLLVTVAVAAVVVSVTPIALFFATTVAGLLLYIIIIIAVAFVLWPLSYYYQRHPVNYLLLGIFTICIAFVIGKVILEAAILTAVVVLSLTFYTFWAAKRGHDFKFLAPFMFGAVVVLIVFAFTQIFFPLGELSVMIYGFLASIIFCGYIIYDTDNLIKRYTYDEHIWASVALYLDIVNLFQNLLAIFRAAET